MAERFRHWRFLACAALLALAAVQPFSGRPALAQTAESPDAVIRVGVGPDEATTPLLYTAQAGIYKKYGLNVQIVALRGGAAVAAALAGGSLEIGKTSALGVITAVAKGIPFTTIGSISYYNADKPNYALLVAADAPVKTASDLVGKTMGAVSLEDSNSIAMFAWLEQRGVDHTTIKLVEIPASAELTAMEQGRVVGSTFYEPFFTQFVNSGKARVLGYPYSAIGKHFSDSVLFADTKWADSHRAVLARFLRATDEGSKYIAAHENEGTAIIAKFSGADPAAMANIRKPGRGVALNASDLQPLIDTAAKYKVIPQAFPAQTMICTCALRH
ncbi:MAG TPA: ABC transporter substrate-binding protein [Candidatus Acidoferrales bacterium]|nr:ABC transporter substrate-binding protein [Candidatus Acidoferrales bacterium]